MSTYTPISSQTLSASASTITFDGIPQTYTDLVVIISCPGAATGGDWAMRYNNDTATNYSRTYLFGTGSAAGSGRNSSASYLALGAPRTNGWCKISIQNYSNTTTNKTCLWVVGSAGDDIAPIVGLWRSTSAINRLDFFGPTWPSGSTFTLYGIGAGSPKAFGGDTVTTDGTYWYHTFRSSGIFAPMSNLTCDYLVVAGGGGSANGQGSSGGGGGGGVRCTVGATGGGGSLETALNLSAGSNVTVTVGAGGAGSTTSPGGNGSSSTFSTITATGGGGSGGGTLRNGASGGSGGGGGEQGSVLGTGGAGTTNQGFAGAAGQSATYPSATYGAGGGGGSSAAATTHVGGAGIATSISGSSQNYGGGGGGGSYSATNTGGSGGGGKGRTETTQGFGSGTAGTANTGGGGGGAIVGNGVAGGSGVVIVRYAV